MTTHDTPPRVVVAERQFSDRDGVSTLIFAYDDGLCSEIQPAAEKGLVVHTSYTSEGVASAPHKITDAFYREGLLLRLAEQMRALADGAGK